VGPVEVTMRIPARPAKVTSELEDGPVDWQWENGTLTIRLATVRIHALIAVTTS